MVKKGGLSRGLGRGFESLIPTDLLDESFDPTAEQDEQVSDLRQIKLTEIAADPDQPRRTFDDEALQELAASIREHGVLQPIVVTPAKDTSGYQIVAGERRYRASKLAGLDKITALVRTLSDQHKLELSLIENIQRRDLNPIETATAYLKLRDQFNLNLEQIGQRVGGKSMSAISNTLRLLKLPKNARQLIAEGKITEGQARPLIGLDESLVEEILARIVKESLSARAIEQLIVDLKGGAKKPTATQAATAVNAHETEVNHFAERFNAKVKIRTNAKGAGQLIIPFKNDEDFERIKNLLG